MASMPDELLLSTKAFKDLIQSVLGEKVPFRVKAAGSSMSPFIRDGDIIVISPLINKKPRCGDIVAFIRPLTGAVIVHRVVKKNGADYFIRGDNPLGAVEIVTKDCLLGRVTKVEHKGKRIRFWLGSERIAIAFFNRCAFYSFLVRVARRVYRQVHMRAIR